MKKLAFWFFILLAILPLVFLKKYDFGYHTPKILAFWFMLIIYVFIESFQLFNSKSFSFSINHIGIALIFYSIVLIISGVLSQSPGLAFYSTFERMDGIIAFLFFALYYFIFSNQKIEENIWQKIVLISSLVAAFVSIIAIMEFNKGPYVRAQSTFSNPLALAYYLVFHFIIVFGNFISNIINHKTNKLFENIISIILLVIFGIGILSSSSRSAILTLAISIMFLLVYYFVVFKKSRKNLSIISLLFIGLNALVLLKLVGSKGIIKRIASFNFDDDSANIRIYLWKTIQLYWTDKPLLGWGKEQFVYFFAKHYQIAFHNSEDWYDRSHNFFLDKLIESGIIGFMTYIGFMILSLWSILNKKSQFTHIQKGILLTILISFCVFHFTNFESFPSYLILFSTLIFISQKTVTFNFKTIKIHKILSMFLLLILGLTAYQFVFKTWNNYKTWNNIKIQSNNYVVVNQYEGLIENASIGKYDILLKYGLNRSIFLNDPNFSLIKPNYINSAEKEFQNYLIEVPNHPILLSQLGFIQFESGKTDEAIKTYEYLRTLAPKRHTNILDLASMYMINKNYAKALELCDFVLSYDSMYEVTHLNKAYCFAQMNDKIKAKECLQKLSPRTIELNQQKYDMVKNILK